MTANAALDVTYTVPTLTVHGSHRVSSVTQRAGGKGINVAAVLAQLGHEVVVAGCAGGPTGEQIRRDLDVRGLSHRLTDLVGDSRRTVNVVDADTGDATIFNEAGPAQPKSTFDALVRDVVRLVQEVRAQVVVLSGSLPTGFPADAYARLVTQVHEVGVPVIVDADGETLALAVAAHPEIIKPNSAELASATGESDPVTGAAALRALGARDVVVSAGADGVLMLPAAGGNLRARLATPLSGNPTGAGDALVAALAAGLAGGRSNEQIVRDAVAWSAAAVLQPAAGQVDPTDVTRLESQVRTEEIV
ncbi:1-phosphofructokinase family hexose kinase [Leekyejoonella antrihumi]|uniref:1-phosphofructokinase family hexose kinase n=1 Tax=Leekyejoonella antrihumi TaxID=1660198 RepID=UPI001C9646B5|nr:hexose kinase [Leekyejoonella antrihumi]